MGKLANLGRRLGEERSRLGLNQQEFARACGVTKNSQSAYETGKTPPTVEYLLLAEEVGADLGFVLWGTRSSGRLGLDETEILDSFHLLKEQERIALLTIAGSLAGRATPPRPVQSVQSDPLAAIPAEALEETLFHLLDGIDRRASADERAHLLAARLPNALSLLRDQQPASPPLARTRPAPTPAAGGAPATPARERLA